MQTAEPIVYVIDDDEEIRSAMRTLMRSVGLNVETFACTKDFLLADRANVPSCLLLDVRMPETSGLDFQRLLAEAEIHVPIIFMSGHGDVPMTVRAMKDGALEFLTKPVRSQELLDAIHHAIIHDQKARAEREELSTLRNRLLKLTAREKEVAELVVAGLLNKQIADQLGMSEPTVKTHRSRVMAKAAADSLAELVRTFEKVKRADSE